MDNQTELKKITDVNLETISQQFAAVLIEHFGGEIQVNLTKFQQIEHTGAGITGYGERIVIELDVRDKSRIERLFKDEDFTSHDR